jgi:hypothetical protein
MSNPISYSPFLGWVDATDPNNLPVDVRIISAADLLRYENFGVTATTKINAESVRVDDAIVRLDGIDDSVTALNTSVGGLNTSVGGLTTRVTALEAAPMALAIPSGVTTMKALNTAFDYYASSTVFATFTTDRPTGVTGAHFIEHSRRGTDVVIQTITRNTTSTPVQYFRLLYTDLTASAWQKVTSVAVAYSAT